MPPHPLGPRVSGITGSQHRQGTFQKSPRSTFFLGKTLRSATSINVNPYPAVTVYTWVKASFKPNKMPLKLII